MKVDERARLALALIAATLLGGCGGLFSSDRNFNIEIDRPAKDVIAALDAVALDVGRDSVAPFMAGVKIRASHPDPQTVLLTIAGDTAQQDIHYTISVGESGSRSTLHVETDIPASVGIEDGRLHKINGDGFAANMRTEFAGLAKRLEAGDAPAKAAWSMQMAMHILGQSNRKSTQQDWAKVQADPKGYASQAGRDAADRYIEEQNLPPEQEERVKAAVDGALDHQGGKSPDAPDDTGWGAANRE